MKNVNVKYFAMLLVLAVGPSVSHLKADVTDHHERKMEHKSFMDRMHELQHEISSIHKAKKDCCKATSLEKLERIGMKINELADDKSCTHVDMCETHIHTLRRELKDARHAVKEYAPESSEESMHEKKEGKQKPCKSSKKCERSEKSSESFLDRMHDMQHELHEIREAKHSEEKEVLAKRLSKIASQIKILEKDSSYKNEDESMHKVHIHTLRRELEHAREVVGVLAKKSSEKPMRTKSERKAKVSKKMSGSASESL